MSIAIVKVSPGKVVTLYISSIIWCMLTQMPILRDTSIPGRASPLGLTPLATRVSSFMAKLELVFLENQNLVLF